MDKETPTREFACVSDFYTYVTGRSIRNWNHEPIEVSIGYLHQVYVDMQNKIDELHAELDEANDQLDMYKHLRSGKYK